MYVVIILLPTTPTWKNDKSPYQYQRTWQPAW